LRALVTGGAGFIGSHVADALLARGDEVTILDDLSDGKREHVPDGARLVEGDIRDPAEASAVSRPEVVFHLAAQKDVRASVARPDFDADVNVVGTVRILEAAREHGAQIVFSSTGGAIYGECEEPAPEDKPREPLAPYGASKLAGEEYLAMYSRLHGARHVSLRYGNVYGPRQDPHGEAGVVAIFFNRLRDGEPPTVFGNGSQTRDYVYVGDVVAALLAAARSDAHGSFNVGTGRETTVLELAAALSRLGRGDLEYEHAEARPGEVQRIAVDASRARGELGWEAQVDLDEGLRHTLASLE
jgi:UDP-glucose 4-epimerase